MQQPAIVESPTPGSKPEARMECWLFRCLGGENQCRLEGTVYGHHDHAVRDGSMVITSAVSSVDLSTMVVETARTRYRLGIPR